MKKTGTLEWMPHSFNCVLGCANNCRYCYARRIKKDRFKQTQDWSKEILLDRMKEASKLYKGGVMFPTAHDITAQNYEHCAKHLKELIGSGNKVLIVSKMCEYVARRFCIDFSPSENIEFRLTMNCVDDYWQQGSPYYMRTIGALVDLQESGFKTSISFEPMLCHPDYIVRKLLRNDFVKRRLDSIWFGCLTGYKLNPAIPEEKAILELYKPENLKRIYAQYKDDPKINFKESFRRRIKLNAVES